MACRPTSIWSPLWGAALCAFALFTGCQGGSPAAPPATTGERVPDAASFAASFGNLPEAQQAELTRVWDAVLGSQSTGMLSLGEYELQLDLATGGFALKLVDRYGQAVQDVTGVLNNPACPNNNCVNFVLNSRDTQTGRTSLTIYLFNPSDTKVWNVRFIWTNLQDNDKNDDGSLRTDNDVIILNAKGWTNEFDDYGTLPLMAAGDPDYTAYRDILDRNNDTWPPINPFHTLNSNQTDQSLEGKALALTDVDAIVRGDTANVRFMVTASVGGQRQDPYEFGSVVQAGLMDDNLFGKTQIRAVIRDHQGDIGFFNPPDPDPTHLGVEFHAPDFWENSSDEIFQMEWQPPDLENPEGYYFLDLENWQAERAGDYPFIIRAHSDVNPAFQENYNLYWSGTLKVVRDPSGGGGGGGGGPSQNAIAYISTEFGDADILLDRLGGGGQRVNLNGVGDPGEGGADDIDPAFSAPYANPLGGTKRWIAWASNRGTNGNFRIFVWDVNGQGSLHTFPEPIAVTSSTDNCTAPAWAPNNSALVCQCVDNRGRWAVRKYPIQLHPTDALPPIIQPPIQLTRQNTGDNTNPSFDRSGQFVVFDSTRIRQDNAEIFVMDANGENILLNRITYQTGHDRDPVFSSGTGFDQILYQHQASGGWEIRVATFSSGVYIPPVMRNGVQVAVVINSSGDDINPAISPDGRQVIFASNRASSGAFNLYTANAAPGGGGEVRRTNTNDDEYRPAWGLDVF